MVLWSIDTRDWEGKTAFEIEEEIMNNISDGSIILMHDYVSGNSYTSEALRNVIPKLKELGYCFVTVSELIGN
jgi:peptidoglycan/xylan/chitin deacetylase (PgdA/CDA1 family)